MPVNSKVRLFALAGSSALIVSVLATNRPVAAGQCVDFSTDPAGCQPSTFDTPIGDMPSVRIGRTGNLDPMSSEADARAGTALLEKKLHLFRNMEHLHWVITVPSVKDEATGNWKDGDLDAAVEAMMRGATLPPFPSGLTDLRKEYTVNVRFRLDR